ncbi:hypothetical protein FH972_008697 [Carpinus fangiana]|uniref:KIB1-4 beta-propeller domain-containing protein n=1 Tax=Carpinus fangiana TaxID=176857 RepID=A0A5N6QZK2_9ROSI|nr:hypothetical protein FH972_008697 [Carpinus fangiana]
MAISSLESDWALLPKDLLESILYKVASAVDRVRFGAVCKPWGTAVKERQQGTQIPMLLIPGKDNNDKVQSLYSITDQRISDVNLSIPYNRRCCGSSLGWLSFVTESSFILLFNPFKNTKIYLPRLEKIIDRVNAKQYMVRKLTLSSDPAENSDCLVVVIFGAFSDLVFMKLGDESWTYVDIGDACWFFDVLYYKGHVLAINQRGMLVSLDVNTGQPNILAPQDLEHAYQTYLVEISNGDLLLLRRFVKSYPGYFTVHKLVLDDESGRVERVEVKNIGDNALFVGGNYSVSISTSNFPECESNSIYFTDDYNCGSAYERIPDVPYDVGIYTFNLEDGSAGLHYKPISAHRSLPPPIWILPPIYVARETMFDQF